MSVMSKSSYLVSPEQGITLFPFGFIPDLEQLLVTNQSSFRGRQTTLGSKAACAIWVRVGPLRLRGV